jgi:hypothetical protein
MVTKLREQLDRVGTTGWLAVLAVLAFLRSPHVLLEGRFWAEEGSIHFAHAYAEGGIAGLTFIDQRAGYLNLIPNVGTWLATLVPLSVAPLVTTWLAFGVLLFVLWIAVAWPSDLLPTPGARLIAAGLLLFGPAAHPEVWLNTINSQTHLGIAGILLAFVRLDDLSRRRFHLSVTGLVVAALSGLYTTILTPLFVWRAHRQRTRRSIIHAAVIAGTTAFQGVIVLVSRTSGSLEESKLTIPDPAELLGTFAGLHLAPIVIGRQPGDELAANVIEPSGPWVITVVVVAALIIGVVAFAAGETSAEILVPLGAAFVLVEGFVQLGAWGIADARYAVVPLAILSLLLAHAVGASSESLRRGAAIGLVAAAMIAGLTDYWTEKRIALACIECPDWQAEVDGWEADPNDDLQIWPYPPWPFTPWTIELPAD